MPDLDIPVTNVNALMNVVEIAMLAAILRWVVSHEGRANRRRKAPPKRGQD